MAKFTSITKNKAAKLIAKVGDMLPDNTIAMGPICDVRFIFTFTIDADCTVTPPNGAPRYLKAGVFQLNCFTSCQKHIAESYHDIGDYRPTPAKVKADDPPEVRALQDRNTITSLTLAEFVDAFDEYGNHLIARMIQQDVAAFQPDAVGKFDTSKGVAFTNNNDSFGRPFHCFPTAPTVASPNCRDLTGRELMDFVEMMSFRFDGGVGSSTTANMAQAKFSAVNKKYDQYKNAPWFQALASAPDRAEIKDLLDESPDLIKEMRKKEGEAKRLLNLKNAK
jgi:hypothetical protein